MNTKDNRKGSNNAGFTIVELMVTLAVAAILATFALPALTDFLDQRTTTARIIDFVFAVNYARSEATKLGAPVSIQAVDASANGNEWGPGYCVVVGTPGNCNAPVLRSFQPLNGMTLNGTAGFNNVGTLTFNSRGMLTLGVAGTVQLCSTDVTRDPGREVSISVIGRAATEQFICHP